MKGLVTVDTKRGQRGKASPYLVSLDRGATNMALSWQRKDAQLSADSTRQTGTLRRKYFQQEYGHVLLPPTCCIDLVLGILVPSVTRTEGLLARGVTTCSLHHSQKAGTLI